MNKLYKKYSGENLNDKGKSNYFEGWYYKLVSKDENHVYSFIPGISYPETREKGHSFIQVINGKTGVTNYINFSVSDFLYNKKTSSLKIKDNTFSKHGVKLNIKDNNIEVIGTLLFNNITPIERNLLSPGAMGFFSYFPFMECNHEIISMNHSLDGTLKINNHDINFNMGKGYIEKDWGTSFPEKWVWIHSNHFSNASTSIMCSIAKIPFLGSSFNGFICILTINNKEYRFATYNKSKIKELILLKNNVYISLGNSKYTLNITASINEGGNLQAPVQGNMVRKITESLNSSVEIKLKDSNNSTLYEDKGHIVGLEITGYN